MKNEKWECKEELDRGCIFIALAVSFYPSPYSIHSKGSFTTFLGVLATNLQRNAN